MSLRRLWNWILGVAPLEYEIHPGVILLEPDPIDIVVNRNDVKVVEINLRSKYPGEIFVETDSQASEVTFLLMADSGTLNADRSTSAFTRVVFRGIDGDWHYMTDGARYTVRIAMYKRSEEIW